jgi:hypothetical protein
MPQKRSCGKAQKNRLIQTGLSFNFLMLVITAKEAQHKQEKVDEIKIKG